MLLLSTRDALHIKPTRLSLALWLLLATITCLWLTSAVPTVPQHHPRGTPKTTTTHTAQEEHMNVYQQQALANLSSWRSSLFYNTMQLQREAERKLTREQRKSGSQTQIHGHRRFDLFNPFITCPGGEEDLQRVGGSGDGGKKLCASMLQPKDTGDDDDGEKCIVYSMGSNSDYSFEQDVLKLAPSCRVVTFDCTVFEPPQNINPRHTLVKKCIGTQQHMQNNPSTWSTLTAAMTALNHTHITLLKIDIEGAEYDVLSTLYTTTTPVTTDADTTGNNTTTTSTSTASTTTNYLPVQIAMELHYDNLYLGTLAFNDSDEFSTNLLWPRHTVTLSDMALFMGHLAGLGYGVVSREDNVECVHCSELTLLRVV